MESITQKFKRNLKEGTLFKNATIALRNRLIKQIKTSNLIYLIDKKRVLTKKYQNNITRINTNHIKVGNYYLDSRIPINKQSIVYSLGILTDISFDLHLQKNYDCKIFMYDPSPVSIAFMKDYASNELLKFEPIGVWVEDAILRFYEPRFGGSATVMHSNNSSKYFDAKCLTMETIMNINQHSEISIFKADIEGAALPVLNQMIQQEIFPDQVVVEFERPQGRLLETQNFFVDLTSLRTKMKHKGYEEYLLPREESKYISLEMLFVNKNKIQ